jgi:MFS family permease
MAFGLLSIFIPLYVVRTLGGSLVEFGIMVAAALLFSIPASFFWGYICDKTRRYKIYILISFISATIIIYVFTLTTSILLFIILYVAMAMLHVAHEAPKNVLIAEHYSRNEWEKSFASYQRTVEVGWLLGLLLGLIAATFSLSTQYTLFLCSGLNLAAFVLSIFLVADPLLIFERRLVSIEKKIDYASRGVNVASQILGGYSPTDKLKKESFLAFGIAILFFSLASNIFFTPMPIFFAQKLGLPTNMIFVIYMLNSVGAIVGYSFIKRRSMFTDSKKQIRRIVLLRSALIFLLVGSHSNSFFTNRFCCTCHGAAKSCLRNLLYPHDFTSNGTYPPRKNRHFRCPHRLRRRIRLFPRAFFRPNARFSPPVPNCQCHLSLSICHFKDLHLTRNSHKKRQAKQPDTNSNCPHRYQPVKRAC